MGNASAQPDATIAAVAELIEEVLPSDPKWHYVENLLSARMSHFRHYRFKMRITRLFHIRPSEVLKSYEAEARRQGLGKPHVLFHGTTPANAESILAGGFSIPSHPGMFGRGIYFAKDPLKSVRYAQQVQKPSHLAESILAS